MSTTKGKGSFVVMLEGEKKAPKLIVNVKSTSKNMFLISVIHPNTRQVIFEGSYKCKDFNEAFEIGNDLKTADVVLKSPLYTDPEYEEILFIPNPKKGKMKLNTQEEAEDELNASLDSLIDDEDDYSFSEEYIDEDEVDEKPKKNKALPLKKDKTKPVKKVKTKSKKKKAVDKTSKKTLKVAKKTEKDNIKTKTSKKINKKTKK